jgi:hypothetical protein
METSADQAPLAPQQDTLEDLAEKFGEFFISSPTRAWKHLKQFESYLDMTRFFEPASKPSDNHGPSLARLPLGLRNTASVYQTMVSRLMLSTLIMEEEQEEIPLMGAQLDLVLTATSQGNIVHWLGTRLLGNSTDAQTS